MREGSGEKLWLWPRDMELGMSLSGCTHSGLKVERKPFALGVRIEHPQSWVNARQYRLRGDFGPMTWACPQRHIRSGDPNRRRGSVFLLHVPGRGHRTLCHRGWRSGHQWVEPFKAQQSLGQQRHCNDSE